MSFPKTPVSSLLHLVHNLWMIETASWLAGSYRFLGVGWMNVPYERAMEGTRDKDPDRAAPMVPDDNAKAAVDQ